VTVDSLTFVGESLFGQRATVDELLRMLDETEVERAVVCPFRPRSYRLEEANDVVAAAVERHPDRLIGFARVDPNLGDAAAGELARATAELGLRGLYLHPWEETFRVNDVRVDELLDGFALPVIVAAGYPWLSEGLQVGELARRHPDVRVIATNGCQINISGLGQTDAELALAANPNLVVQTTGVYREDFIEGVAARFGPERLLYASGFPLFDPRLEVLRVRWAPNLGEGDRALALGGNADRLLRAEPA
jgi:predicted TIM-barrel fold metal-dependent hydrolase